MSIVQCKWSYKWTFVWVIPDIWWMTCSCVIFLLLLTLVSTKTHVLFWVIYCPKINKSSNFQLCNFLSDVDWNMLFQVKSAFLSCLFYIPDVQHRWNYSPLGPWCKNCKKRLKPKLKSNKLNKTTIESMCNLDSMDMICIVNNILEFVGRVSGRDKREEWELCVCC